MDFALSYSIHIHCIHLIFNSILALLPLLVIASTLPGIAGHLKEFLGERSLWHCCSLTAHLQQSLPVNQEKTHAT